MAKVNPKTSAAKAVKGRGKSEGETRGQFERDPKNRKGQYTAAGDPGITKK